VAKKARKQREGGYQGDKRSNKIKRWQGWGRRNRTHLRVLKRGEEFARDRGGAKQGKLKKNTLAVEILVEKNPEH